MADLPPLRSLRDFLTDAQFTTPSFDDLERLSNRMANNLLYYQTNHFLLTIAIFVIVGCIHPMDFILGALCLVAAVFLYKTLTNTKDKHTHQFRKQHPLVGPAVVLGLLVILRLLSSIMVFMFGIIMPIGVVLLHSACRKRNLKNKFTNIIMTELKDNPTPMGVILHALYQLEDKMEHSAKVVSG